MKRIFPSLAISIAIFLSITACGTAQSSTPAIPSEDLIATGVKATLDAMQTQVVTEIPVVDSTILPQPAAEPELPHSVYYLAKDSSGVYQVWRLETDAITNMQITTVQANVIKYSISPTSGMLAFVSDNDLFIQTHPGTEQIRVLDTNPDDGSELWFAEKAVSFPVWSRDGKRLAFFQNGIHIYTPADGSVVKILTNKYRGKSPKLVDELYYPLSWSPDDSQILVGISYYENGSSGVYTFSSSTLTKLNRADGGCACGVSTWYPEGGKVAMAGFSYGGPTSEMWQYSTQSDSSGKLLPEKNTAGAYNFAIFPYIKSGEIYYMYSAPVDQVDDYELTGLVKAPITDPTNMTRLRTDEQLLVEAIWSEDGSMVVGINTEPGFDYPIHGKLVKLSADAQPMLTLVADAREIQWGP